MSGLSGLVNIPTAATLPSGMVEFSYTTARSPDSFTLLEAQRNAFITLGVLPWLTVGIRGTSVRQGPSIASERDASDNAQIRLLQEQGWMPALAVGGFDLVSGQAAFFRSLYAVMTKSIGSRLALTGGVGSGPRIVKGAFGGAEVKLLPWTSALGDFDGRHVGLGLRINPFPAIADRMGVQPRFDFAWRQGIGTAIGIGLRTSLGGWPESPPKRPPEALADTAQRASASASPTPSLSAPELTGTHAVQAALVAEGFENVQASIESGDGASTIAVEYENRRYNRDELDALGVVMAVTARYAPSTVTRMQVTIRRVNLAVITVACFLRDFSNFVDGQLEPEAFGNQLEITAPRSQGTITDATGVAAHSRWKLDVVPQPLVKTAVLNEIGAYQARYSLLADGWMQLAPGVVLNAQHTVAQHQDPTFPGWLYNSNTDRVLLHAAVPVTTPTPWGNIPAITQLTVGRFNYYQVGVADETNVTLANGWLSLDGTLGMLGPSSRQLTSVIALAGATVRYAPLDLTGTLTVGRFRNGDDGATAEVARWFGSSQLGFFVNVTNFGRFAGVRYSLPLTPTRELPPWLIRPRLPDQYTQRLQGSIEHANAAVRTDLAQLLDTDHDIARAYLDRDRLNAATIRQHVETIRASAVSWSNRVRPR